MKIGILSMQRIVNYGSFMQAYGLKKTIESLGHTCDFIDIKGQEYRTPESYNIRLLKKGIRYFTKNKDFRRNVNRQDLFVYKFFPILGLEKQPNYFSNYDTVVIGSDEVFNCTQKSGWRGSMQFFGEGIESNNIISYAGCFGHTTIDELRRYNMKESVTKNLKNFKSISVRDENSSYIIKELTGNDPFQHLDPVFIYDYPEVNTIKIKNKDYIIVYAYNNRIKEQEYINAIKEFASKKNKKILGVGVFQDWCDENIIVTPFELLAYFKNADYVVTDTFHGTVFSIKYKKKFTTIIRESNKQKLSDLLRKFNLQDRALSNIEHLEEILDSEYDYKYVDNKIKEEKLRSIEYLRNNIK